MPKNSATDIPTSFEVDKFIDSFALEMLALGLGSRNSFFPVYFGEHFLGDVEGRVRSRHAAENRTLQQHFLNFIASYFIIQGGSDVHPEFVAANEGDHHRERNEASRVSRKSGPRPDFSPGVARDEILERLVE